MPLTNDPGSLAALGGVYTTPHGEPMAPVTVQAYLEKTRTHLLQNLFPVPTSDVDAEWIINTGMPLKEIRRALEGSRPPDPGQFTTPPGEPRR